MPTTAYSYIRFSTTEQLKGDSLRRQLLAELRQAQERRAETELSPEAFAVYWLLEREGVAKAHDVAQAAAAAFEQNPIGRFAAQQEQVVRKNLYKAMITAGIDGVVDLAQRLMKMLRRTP